jgi:hypothetical protein
MCSHLGSFVSATVGVARDRAQSPQQAGTLPCLKSIATLFSSGSPVSYSRTAGDVPKIPQNDTEHDRGDGSKEQQPPQGVAVFHNGYAMLAARVCLHHMALLINNHSSSQRHDLHRQEERWRRYFRRFVMR